MVFIRRDQIPLYTSSRWTTFIKPFESTIWISLFLITLFFVLLEFFVFSKNSIQAKFLFEIILNKIGRFCLQGILYFISKG